MPEPIAAEVRKWARAHGLAVGGRGRLPPHVLLAYQEAREADTVLPRLGMRTVRAKPVWDWQRRART